jgi:hypothetical protein
MRQEAVYPQDHQSPLETSSAERMQVCLQSVNVVDQTHLSSQVLGRSRGACYWITTKPKFLAWKRRETSNALWITAKAGCGKTALAAHVAEMLSAGAHRRDNGDDATNLVVQRSSSKETTTRLYEKLLPP